MIPHTSAESLLAMHGNTAAGRAKARTQVAREIRAAIDREIAEAGRSMRCGGGDHRRNDEGVRGFSGCANDGTTCLCECHDPEEPRP